MATPGNMIDELASFMHLLADASGAAILPFYRTALTAEDKAAGGAVFDPVTAADRAGEAAIRALINRHYPTHGIIGEEFGSERPDAEFVWVLDPVDGTKSFISGMPTWGTLIGLLHQGRPCLGVLDQPYLEERFWGNGREAECTSSRDRRRLMTRQGTSLDRAVVWASSTITTNPAQFARVQRLVPQVGMLRYGNDCYGMAMLAEGHIDLVIETGLEIYDIAAHIPIVEGAGGLITGIDGGAALAAHDFVAAGDRDLHGAALAVLAS